jgi:hypothetical protein
VKRSEIDALRKRQRNDVGLLLLYPVDPKSPPTERSMKGRSALDAPSELEVVMGAAFVFPKPPEDSSVEHHYVSADLSKIVIGADAYLEEEDPGILEQDDEDDIA